MASFRKTKLGKWEAMIRRKGHPGRSGTFPTRKAAGMWASKVEAEMDGGKTGAVDKTFKDLMERFRSEHKVKSAASVRSEKNRIASILRHPIAKMNLRELNQTHFSKWRDDRLKTVAPGTVIRDMGLMSSAFNLAIKEWKWLDDSPMKGVARPKEPEGRDRRITDDEIDRILFSLGYEYDEKPESVRARTAAAFLFCIETAMRAGEAATLTWDRVYMDRRVAHIRSIDSKTQVKRDVPLSPEAIRILLQMGRCEGGVFGVSASQISAAFIKAKKAAMIKDLHFHDSRHEAITRLSKKFDVLALARVVGHTDINQLLVYYNMSADDLAAKL